MSKLLLLNGNIYTSPNFQKKVEAVYIENGRIVALGANSELKLQFYRADIETIDLEGSSVYPGLVDNHMHLPGHGMRLKMLDLSTAKSKQEMLHLVKQRLDSTPEGEWVLGFNWNENLFDIPLIPTIQELDQLSQRHPIFLTRTCTHVYIANTTSFQRAGIHEGSSDPVGGAYGRDAKGQLNGLIFENASIPFYEVQPKPDYEDKKDNVRQAIKHALSLGLTAAHTEDLRYLGDMETLLRIYRELQEEGLYFRTNHLIYYPHLSELDELDMTTGDGDEWLCIGAVKIFSDGSIGGRTALLSEPYYDAPNTKGMAIHSQEEFNEITQEARKRNMPIAVHAIGDGGAEITIRAMEAFPVQQVSRYRDRLIHAQVIRRDQIERLKKLQAVVDIQPRFVASDFPWVIERVGKARYDCLYPWKTLLKSGIPCGGGSDAPIEPLDPLLGIHAAVTRRKPEEKNNGYIEKEKLSIAEAVRLFTFGSAQTATEETERGSIEVGKYADLTVLDKDLLKIEPDDILNAKTAMTIVNGMMAYRRSFRK